MRRPTPLLLTIAALLGASCIPGPSQLGSSASETESDSSGASTPGLEVLRPGTEAPAPSGFVPTKGGDSKPAPPIELVTPDGIALELRQLHAETVMEGPLAYTELRLSFRNPEPRRIEGRFRIALPPRAALARLAMNVNGAWQEGEVLERKLATLAYEDSLHRKVDPALLEQGAGNSFSARIFPIEPGEEKRIVIGYSQTVTDADRVLVPLHGLAPIADARARLWRAGVATETVLAGVRQDLEAVSASAPPEEGDALRSGDLVALRVRPVSSQEPAPLESLVVLVDTSASRGLDLAAELELVRGIASRLASHPNARLAIIAYDQTQELVFNGLARDLDETLLARLERRHALGASDLGRALEFAGALARTSPRSRVLLLGDGIVTAGRRGTALVDAARRLADQGVERLDAIALGGIRDEDALRSLATSGLPKTGFVGAASLGLDTLWSRLGRSVRERVSLDVEGASWVHPREVRGVVADEDVVVFARLSEDREPTLKIDGRAVSTRVPTLGSRALLERAAAAAELDELAKTERERGTTPELRARMIDLSTRNRVVSPHTALLVLETEADYQRLGIARGSLAPIVTVANGRLAEAHRNPPPVPVAAKLEAPPPSREEGAVGRGGVLRSRGLTGATTDAFGAGGLGLSGIGEGGGGRGGVGPGLGSLGPFGGSAAPSAHGREADATPKGSGQGFGAGHGRLSGSHREGRPWIRMDIPDVSSAMPMEVVRRIVRQNLGRFRLAYDDARRRDPSLTGTLRIDFAIAASGMPISVSVNGPGPRSFHEAVGRGFWMLQFPPTEGGAVRVHQRIHFGGQEHQGPVTTTLVPKPRTSESDPRPSAPVAPVPEPRPSEVEPYDGTFADVMSALDRKQVDAALAMASKWHARAPGEALAHIALGASLDQGGHHELAARAYGSLIDLFPERVEVLRYAASRLLRVSDRNGVALALDALANARTERPDHATGHRLYAYALLGEGRHEEAFDALRDGYRRGYPDGRFLAVKEVLAADLALVATVWSRAKPADARKVQHALDELGLAPDTEPSRRFVLSWESDASDVDLHVFDDEGGHAWYSSPNLPSGGRLLADVTTGFGPEMFSVRGSVATKHSYRLAAHFYARGPMGFGMGRLQIVDHDGKGHLTVDERPFVVMNDHGLVTLGTVTAKAPARQGAR
jgi:hypothetical protein